MDFIKEWQQLNLESSSILVAVSTGVDSMCLLDMLQRLPADLRPKITVAYVDHQLRKEGHQETEFIKQYCQDRHLNLKMTVWPKTLHPQNGIEEAARKFRYHFFAQVMDECNLPVLVTAHHADDLAETVLMKLIRGGQLEQLIGIRQQRPFGQRKILVRPLLSFSKEQLYTYAKDHRIQYFEDQTNQADDVLRNRIRHHVIPMLKAENSQFLKHVVSYTRQLADFEDLSDDFLDQKITVISDENGLKVSKWKKLPIRLQEALLKRYLIQHHLPVREEQFDKLVKFLKNEKKPQGNFRLTKNQQIIKTYHHFRIIPVGDSQNELMEQPAVLKTDQLVKRKNFELKLTSNLTLESDIAIFLATLPDGLILRHRQSGDWLMIKNGHQRLRRFLIDHKVPQAQRDQLWVIADKQKQVYAIFGNQINSLRYLSQPVENATIRYMISIKYRKR